MAVACFARRRLSNCKCLNMETSSMVCLPSTSGLVTVSWSGSWGIGGAGDGGVGVDEQTAGAAATDFGDLVRAERTTPAPAERWGEGKG
jgi:hypothetical protein